MALTNYDDVIGQLRAAGLIIDKELVFDSRIQRWLVEGEDREKRGWTRLREWQAKDGDLFIVGVFGVWRGADEGRMKIELSLERSKRLSEDDIRAMRDAHREAQKRLAEIRKNEAKTAARWAAQVWAHCTPAPVDHEYLVRKQIQPHGTRIFAATEGLRLEGIDDSNWYRLTQAPGALVVPMHDENGCVCGIQFVYPWGHPRKAKIDRDKEFWPAGMAMGGTFGHIGPVRRDGIVLIAEGFATAASLHEATGQTVAYAFSANNLSKAGKLLRKNRPLSKLLFCADDDYLTDNNPGVTYASQASAEIERTAWIKPDFTDQDGNDRRAGKKLTDFNDLCILHGNPLVLANQINAKLNELSWSEPRSESTGGTQTGGGGLTGRKDAVSVMPLDDIVQRFVKLDDDDGKHVFDFWTGKVATLPKVAGLLEAGIRIDDLKRHPVWTSRAFYIDEIGFDPAGTDEYVKLNTWRGWPMKPKAGRCEMLLELVDFLCGADKNASESAAWLLKWMAFPLQNPGAKMQSAIIMHGPQGTGKSTVFKTLARIYGYKGNPHRNYAIVLDQKALQSNFNPDWDDKLFVLAEEVVNSSDKWQLKNELKELVTGDTMRIEGKFLNAVHKKNRINMAFLSNENQPLPLDIGDRRHHVIYTPPALSKQFYMDLAEELKHGGVEAFYDHLLSLDLTGFNEDSTPPFTEAKERLIAISSPSEVRFINEWTMGDLSIPVCPCIAADLYTAYLRWCRQNGETRPRPSNQFHGAISHQAGWKKEKAKVYLKDTDTESVPKPIIYPPTSVLEEHGSQFPVGGSDIAWRSESVRKFANGLVLDAERSAS